MDPEQARPGDLEPVVRLLEECGLPTADLAEGRLEHFLVLRDGEALVACAGMELLGAAALIRSVAVRARDRGRGLGARLTRRIEARAAAGGAEEAYLLTTTADGFFAELGYARIDRQDAPEAVRSTSEFAALCPASAVLMRKTLRSPPGR